MKLLKTYSVEQSVSVGQSVFAKWHGDGYYYPATIGAIDSGFITALFLDGFWETVAIENVIEHEAALNTLQLEGNHKFNGLYYRGVVSGKAPMVMNYDDGDVEQIELEQLRGAKPGEVTAPNRAWMYNLAKLAVAIAIVVGLVVLVVRCRRKKNCR